MQKQIEAIGLQCKRAFTVSSIKSRETLVKQYSIESLGN